MENPKPGKYQYFKGTFYEVIGLATHSETGEELVVYQSLENEKLWARPKKIFLEKVEDNGKQVPRFKFIEEKK